MTDKYLTLEKLTKAISEAPKIKPKTTSELSPKQKEDLLNAMKKLSQEDNLLK